MGGELGGAHGAHTKRQGIAASIRANLVPELDMTNGGAGLLKRIESFELVGQVAVRKAACEGTRIKKDSKKRVSVSGDKGATVGLRGSNATTSSECWARKCSAAWCQQDSRHTVAGASAGGDLYNKAQG